MKINELIEGDILQGPWKEKVKSQKGFNLFDLQGNKIKKPIDTSKLKPVSLYKAFGGEEFILILDAGFKFDEKPSYFESIKNEINVRDINQIQKLIGRRLNTYKANEILTSTEYPQQDANFQNLKQNEETFIVWFPRTKERFLANRTGAQSYIRMWARLID